MTHEQYRNQHVAYEKYIFLLQLKSNVLDLTCHALFNNVVE